MTKVLATLLTSSALCASLPLQAQAELDVVSLKSAIERSVESDYPKLDALYKDIHAHPEIAFQEEKTAGSWRDAVGDYRPCDDGRASCR